MVGRHPWGAFSDRAVTAAGQVIGNSGTGAVVNLAIDGITNGAVDQNVLSTAQGTYGFVVTSQPITRPRTSVSRKCSPDTCLGFTILALPGVALRESRVVRLAAILLSSAIACTSSSPSVPSQGVKGLAIVPARDALYVSEEVQLSVSLDSRPATAFWSSSDESVVRITSTGSARAIAVGNAALTATAQNQTATLTIRVVPDYRGRFAGRLEITRCQRVSGLGPLSDCQSGIPYRINALTINQQIGATGSGVLDVFQEPTVGPINGTIKANDYLALTGTLRSGESQMVLIIEQWDTQLTDSGSRLIGTFSADAQFFNGFGPQHQKQEFRLLEVSRQ